MIILLMTLLGQSSFELNRDDLNLVNDANQETSPPPVLNDLLIVYVSDIEKQMKYISWIMDAQCDRFSPYIVSSSATKKGPYSIYRFANNAHRPNKTELSFLHFSEGVLVSGWKSSLPDIEGIVRSRCLNKRQLIHNLGTEFVFIQNYENACAARSTENMLHRLNYPVDSDVINDALDPGPNVSGTSLLKIKEFFNEIQLKGNAYKGDFDELSKNTPSILYVDGHHFVVVSRVLKDGALVIDPAMGRQYWSKTQLLSRWDSRVYFRIDSK